MLLSHKTVIKVHHDDANIIGHMCYAAYKLWNVCNYERMNYKELHLPVEYPDWYYQKKAHKEDLWYKQLPSQTAQEVCKLLDQSWKSFYKLKKTHGIENPQPPRYKHDGIVITYMQNAIVHTPGSKEVRLTLPKQLKVFMSEEYDICENYLFLQNKIFENTDIIKQIKIYPPVNDECEVIVIYEIADVVCKPDNGKYLSIDPGLHNLLTCYNSADGETFIAGRKYLSLCRYYNREIARVQSQWYVLQHKKGVKYPKCSKHILQLHQDKNHAVTDYLHKCTKAIVDYCRVHDIHTVVIGDITNIRKDNDLGNITNQKLHSLPFQKIYRMLEYKLALEGITFVRQKEAYSSQTSPLRPSVDRENAVKTNRVKRGLYKDNGCTWNADCVGAYNILRLYFQTQKTSVKLNPMYMKEPYILKVAV